MLMVLKLGTVLITIKCLCFGFFFMYTQWHPEIAHHMPGVPTILVGLQSDLRENQNVLERLALGRMKPVAADKARAMAQRVQAKCYMECSTLLNIGVKELLQKMMEVTKSKPKRSKSILKISFHKMFKGKS